MNISTKTWVAFVLLAVSTRSLHAQTAAEWQRRAVEQYPELGVKDSFLNRLFVTAYTSIRRSSPGTIDKPEFPFVLACVIVVGLNNKPEARSWPPEEVAEMVATKLPGMYDQLMKNIQTEAIRKDLKSVREVETDQRSYLGKPFYIQGKLEVSSYYNFGYRDAQGAYFAFEFTSGNNRAHLYMRREAAAGLRKQLLDADGPMNGVFKVVLDPGRFKDSGSLLLELLDYGPPLE